MGKKFLRVACGFITKELAEEFQQSWIWIFCRFQTNQVKPGSQLDLPPTGKINENGR